MENDNSMAEDEIGANTLRSTVFVPVPSTSAAAPAPPSSPPPSTPLPPVQPPAEPEAIEALLPVASLDSTILEILGDDPSVVKQYGKEIQADLAVRLQHIATTGLTKETRKELCDKYLPPNNCILIDAPELNPEIKAAVSEAVIKRDKGIELKQKQLGRAITCISEALSMLMSKEDKDTSVIKLLMDASRLLCDNQNLDSVTRRNFVLFNLKKEMKDQMQKTKVDKLLFGADLAETLKTAKSISKSGADLKLQASSNKVTAPKNKATPQQTAVPLKRNNLNWKAPPLNRRPQGGQRNREPALKRQQANSSQTSYRAPHQRYSNRR